MDDGETSPLFYVKKPVNFFISGFAEENNSNLNNRENSRRNKQRYNAETVVN